MKGKNKLVPRLLGITKECVMHVDEKTKEVIQEWSLTNIKRWAASPKSFTLVGASSSPCPSACSLSASPPWGCLFLLPLPFLTPRWVDGRAEPHSWHSGWPWVLSTYQRGSGRVPASCNPVPCCCRILEITRMATTLCRQWRESRLPS